MDMKGSILDKEHTGLAEQLAEVIGYLRARHYGELEGRLQYALRGATDQFVDQLLKHLRHEEEVLFPILRAVAPSSEADICALEREHRLLYLYARGLVVQVKPPVGPKAYEVARSFSETLINHMDSEKKVLERIIYSLKVPDLKRLEELLLKRQVEAALAELDPHFCEWDAIVRWVSSNNGVVKLVIQGKNSVTSGLPFLRSLLTKHVKERLPGIRSVEVGYENPGDR